MSSSQVGCIPQGPEASASVDRTSIRHCFHHTGYTHLRYLSGSPTGYTLSIINIFSNSRFHLKVINFPSYFVLHPSVYVYFNTELVSIGYTFRIV